MLAVNGGKPAIGFAFPPRSHFGAEEKEAVDRLLQQCIDSGNPPGYNGAMEKQYCQDFAEYLGGGFADAVNSGTTSVFVALRALELPPYSEVVVGGCTDPGGMMPVPLLNMIPAVADAAPGCYNSGAREIEAQITPLTSAILIAHIGGEPCDMPAIMDMAARRRLPVIEDCSQAHGAKIAGRLVGSFGTISAFSTMFGKHHCSGGQGGIVFTKDKDLYWKMLRYADRGKPFGLENSTNCVAALNHNLDEISCAVGIAQLKKLPGIVARRRAFADMLRPRLQKLKTIRIPALPEGAEHSYWWWRLEVAAESIRCSKEEYCKALQAEGVPLNPDYRAAVPHMMEWFRKRRVFGNDSGLPWTSPSYKGDTSRQFPCVNLMKSIACQFNLNMSESWGGREADALAKAFEKVDGELRK